YWIFRPLPWPRVGLFTLTLAFVALSFAGMWLAVRAGIPRTDLLVVGMLLYAAPYALCAAEIYERYRAVMDPLLIGFSAYALCLSWDRMKGFFSKQKTA
ncbi:MAG TPA: hypothetical protein P5079_02180, partial [Elusimicrobiota bacterium]|nr:hypothetical protein [Elusimicrobiota bacterium]